MRKIFRFLTAVLCFTACLQPALAQIDEVIKAEQDESVPLKFLNWYNASPDSLGIQGAAVDKAYNELLQGRIGNEVVVAVIDGGVDINHEDLQGHIWTNEKETANNGIDDDHNGYIDDIHGWNFLGNAAGENVTWETFELTRIVKKYEARYNNKQVEEIPAAERNDFMEYQRAKKEFDEDVKKYTEEKESIDAVYKQFVIASSNIASYLGRQDYTYDDIRRIYSDNEMIMLSRKYLMLLHDEGYTKDELEEIKEENYNHLFYHLNTAYDPRAVIGDDPESQDGIAYGNNDVKGEKAEHGTFVSGIIAGIRNNNKGINGIAASVKIMSLRVVPDGDERDKDVANAIIYAVMNGAQIINCSFGKYFSPQREMVDSALVLAAGKGVLIIHAAGNESADIDIEKHFPDPASAGGKLTAANWITVGASSMKADKTLPGRFSNYGKKSVDLFAPGVDMYSLYPQNKYHTGDGTSFSAPVVTGIAATLKSYFPQLTAAEIKSIILESVTPYPRLKVYLPKESGKQKKKIRFGALSATAGVVNAWQAVRTADEKYSPARHDNR